MDSKRLPGSIRTTSKLFVIGKLEKNEARDDFEDKLERSHSDLVSQTASLNEKQSHELFVTCHTDKARHDSFSYGCLFSILTEPTTASKSFRDLLILTRDSWTLTLTNINILLIDHYVKIKPDVKKQLMWFFREAVKTNVPKIDNVIMNLLRNLNNGTDFNLNLHITQEMVAILDDNRDWLKSLKPKSPNPVTMVSVILRLIVIHSHPTMHELKQREIQLGSWLLRERILDCCEMIGRDLLLLLIGVGKAPEFASIVAELMKSPNQLNAPNCLQLMGGYHRHLTSFIIPYRLNWPLQQKLDFILTKVRMKHHERHLEWLMKQHFSSADHGQLRADSIRYVCNVNYDVKYNNQPDLIPRWNFILWLLTAQPLSLVEQQQCRLCLFWDWLCYDGPNTPISALEPAYSLMVHCLKQHSALAHSLIDWLCRMTYELYPAAQKRIKQNVINAYRVLLDNAVAPASHSSLLLSPRLDAKLRPLVRDVFDELITAQGNQTEGLVEPPPILGEDRHSLVDTSDIMIMAEAKFSDDDEVQNSPKRAKVRSKHSSPPPSQEQPPASASASGRTSPKNTYLTIDDDDDSEGDDLMVVEEENQPKSVSRGLKSESNDRLSLNESVDKNDDDLEQLDSKYTILIDQLTDSQRAKDNERSIELMSQLVAVVLDAEQSEDDSFDSQCERLAKALLVLFNKYLNKSSYYPKVANADSIARAVNAPVFTLFRALRTDDSSECMFDVITDMAESNKRIGFLLLFYLKSSAHELSDTDRESIHKTYKELCENLNESVENQLVKDLEACAEVDCRLLGYLIPFVLTKFESEAQRTPALLHVIVGAIDATQLMDLINQVTCENVKVFRKDTFNALLVASLEWETIEQLFFWKLIESESIGIDWVCNVIPRLSWPEHAEAMSNLILLLKRTELRSVSTLLKHLFGRDPDVSAQDLFVISALKTLIDRQPEDTASAVAAQIMKISDLKDKPAANTSKKGRPLTIERVLGHIDRFRQDCLDKRQQTAEKFMRHNDMQQAFRAVRHVRMKFAELFAVTEILGSDRAQPRRAAKNVGSTKTRALVGGAGDSEDDLDSKQRARAKRRKLEESDSD